MLPETPGPEAVVLFPKGFGAQVEVLAPEGQREEFRTTVERLKKMCR
jgi:hypothetical protein